MHINLLTMKSEEINLNDKHDLTLKTANTALFFIYCRKGCG